MNVAKWLLLGLLALPLAELATFIAVAAAYGFLMALTLVIAGSFAGGLVLRYAGSHHIARIRVAMSEGLGQGRFTALQADRHGGILLIAGILLVIPGLITDFLGLLLLLAAFWQSLTGQSASRASPTRDDGVLDLDPAQWHRVDDPALPDRDW
ncbi:MAG: membrane protein FxsA [Rhodopseudomonas sp.]|nr:membrane protein FxsA [Rhodopseudomonas sp.]